MNSTRNQNRDYTLFGIGAKMPLKMLVFSALLSAISIILGKYLAINAGEFLRFSFENLPIILSGIAFGPIVGGLVGAVSDVLGSLLVGYAINPIITLGACSVGVISGFSYLLMKKKPTSLTLRIIISVFSAHIAGSLIIKSVGLYLMYSTPLLVLLSWRVLNYVIIGTLEVILLRALLMNRSIMKTLVKANSKDSFKNYANSFQAVTVPGLERIAELCRLLGNPDKKLKFIHIAGTNGKGSTCANIACILEDAGYKVGKYISPNLIKVNERISINGADIEDGELSEILAEIEPLCKKVEDSTGLAPTQFEIWTACAFCYFERKKCDYVVLEVGLGGELDATNVIEKCEISIITRLGLDHTQYLGNTIAEIASAKAGIIKKNQTYNKVITVSQNPDAMKVLENRAEKLGKTLTVPKIIHMGTEGAHEIFEMCGIENIKCGISGYHQIENASLAVLAALEMGIDEKFIKSGIRRAKNPARFEIISEEPLVIYDGGHNENGISALMASLDRYYPNAPKTVVFACMKDKEISESLRLLYNENTNFIFTTVKDNPRADSGYGTLQRANAAGFDGESHEDIGFAYRKAISYGKLTVICGSLYLYKDLCEYLQKEI